MIAFVIGAAIGTAIFAALPRNRDWWRDTAVPVLWLWSAFLIIGACVGVWLR